MPGGSAHKADLAEPLATWGTQVAGPVGLSRLASTLCRSLLAAVMLASALLAVAPAFASRLDSDRIAGVPLSRGEVPRSLSPDISAKAGALVTADGTVLWSRRLTSRRAMASTTKIMTALLTLESCGLDEKVKITRKAASTRYAVGLRAGERRTVRELLQLTLVASSNDAATALAIHVGGSVKGFAGMMNARAAELGLSRTHYVNPHGLDAEGHYTSASDLDRLLQVAMRQAEFRRIVKMRRVKLPAYRERAARTLKATNTLLGAVAGIEGGKTGFTNGADHCLVVRATRDKLTLTSVILGSPTSKKRFASSKALLEWGFTHYREEQFASATGTVARVRLSSSERESVAVQHDRAASAFVFDLEGPVVERHVLPARVPVPVFKGQRLGETRVTQGPKTLARVDLVAAEPRASAEETVGSVPVAGYRDRTVAAKTAASSAPVAPYDPTRPVERVVTLEPEVTPPVSAGQELGAVSYVQDGSFLVTVPVIAAESVAAPSIIERAGRAVLSGLSLLREAWPSLVG